MKIKRFFAKDMRTALSEVKEELGADAVIMSNKKVTGGVEIVAAVDTDAGNEPPPASQATRESLANRLGQAKRKLADDKVQLKQSPASRFANVLQNYTGGSQEEAQAETEVDSLSALLKRQAKNSPGQARDQERSYEPPPRAERRASLGGYDQQNPDQGNRRLGNYDPEARPERRQPRNAYGARPSAPSPKHALDIGEYRRPQAGGKDALQGGKRNGNRLDPSRYEPRGGHESDEIESMRNEMASIRRLLEHQLSGLMWQEVERREPMRAMMIKRLEKMGLSPELADQLACYIPEDVPANEAWPALLDLLSDQIITTDDCILETGGVVALLGPTGVGKTTTIAKLAARAAMDFGPEQIALVTTDTYRIGAHEQLATYGRIMGCPVRVAKDAEELADILHQLRHRRLVLLDTAGMGQRDIRLSEQLDTLMQNSGSQIRSFLVLPSTAQRRVLNETIEHFRRIPLSGCVLTKLDESLSLGEVICVSIQNALPIAYLADGQRVPEDIKVATGDFLVARANELLEQELSQQSHYWSSDSSDNQAADFYD
ncbi:flagellar biosynthesis protein FlhF [Photobacterium atrarenae]|uniref:Flagellar biosynthesis protein FlhF n=1 Tax=Photobacterium atrarenae TaxID=865757 RepID=A0ABY5GCS7_9GAMM|nr:flagellar biosynthesis protein FlhF [Photobacterium atrarenae]UTV27015.1 flagellar biosynthesis protein FlhF [Photobacterium atrarenae]